MKQNSIENKQQDIIIQEQELVMTTLNDDQVALLNNPRYLKLIKIIHQKSPMTITEIAEEYAEIMKDDQAKSQSSVYRYLVLLKKHKIVQEAGQRVIEGQTLSQTLYSLTTKYLIVDEPEIDWEGNYGRRIFKEILQILRNLYPNKTIDEKALFQWQLHFQHVVDEGKRKLVNSKNHEILECLSVWAPSSINDLINATGWISVLLKDPSSQQSFLKCFNNSSELETAFESSSTNNAKRKEKAVFQDVIRHFPDLLVVLPTNDPRCRYFDKPAYIPLIHVLRDGPMSIEELVEKYNQIATIPRKRSTIYRYIKTLRNAKLVKVVGQRVFFGKKATQKLYGPMYRVISFEGEYDPMWESEIRLWLLDVSIKIFSFLYPELPKANMKCFQGFRVSNMQYRDEAIIKLKLLEKKTFELLNSCAWKEFYLKLTTIVDYDFFLNIPNMYEHLQKCFSE